jgi:small-conductance mechanosensitive channel
MPRDVLGQIAHDVANPHVWAGAVERAIAILLIALAAWLALALFPAAIRRAGRRPGRPVTLTPIAENAARYAIAFAALVLMLQVVHVNVTAILASAGIASVALGFGAQYLIRDLLAGVSLLAEGVVQIGDLVRIDGDAGTVERITLRILQIRKYNGELLTIPNGAVTKIGNLSRGFGRAIVQVTVPYGQDLGAALDVLRDVGREWAAAHPDDARGEPAVDGTVDLKTTGATMQLSVLVPPGRQGGVEAELRRQVLDAMRRRKINIDTGLSGTIDKDT